MKFEELVSKTRSVKAPEFKITSRGQLSEASLVELMRLTDARTRWGIRAIQAIYIFLILILISTLILSESMEIKLGIGFITVSFILIIFVQQLRFQKYNYSYSAKPVLEFLKDAKKRMRVFTPRTWLVIPVWIFIDVGLCFILSELLPQKQYVPHVIILLQVFLMIVIVLDFYSAYLYWKKEHHPVIIEIDKMLAEIETAI
ncbi:MAG: hypothetical protein ABFS16_05650 [Bacteroidota bacterium]